MHKQKRSLKLNGIESVYHLHIFVHLNILKKISMSQQLPKSCQKDKEREKDRKVKFEIMKFNDIFTKGKLLRNVSQKIILPS